VIAVHVADPKRLGNVGLELLLQKKPGRDGAAVKQKTGFSRLDQYPGMFTSGAGMAVGGSKEDGSHAFDVATFLRMRQWKTGVI
jgi:hypothetical protein